MPLPCPQVLNDILDLYIQIREEDTWNSVQGKVKEKTTHFVGAIGTWFGSNVEDDATQRKTVCDDLKAKFRKAKTVDDWIAIIYDLAEEAKKAQEKKYASDESLACETLHAIRNYIVRTITKQSDNFHADFDLKLQELIAQRDKLDSEIKLKRLHSNSLGVGKLKPQLEAILLKLAFLGDVESICRTGDRKILTYLKILEQKELAKLPLDSYDSVLNEEIPYCLQADFCRIFYKINLQKRTNISFAEFEKRALEASIQAASEAASEKLHRAKEEQEAEELNQKLRLVIEEGCTQTNEQCSSLAEDAPRLENVEIVSNQPVTQTENHNDAIKTATPPIPLRSHSLKSLFFNKSKEELQTMENDIKETRNTFS